MARETDTSRSLSRRPYDPRRIRELPGGEREPGWLDRKLARPPRKIRRWVAKTGAQFARGRGWYVEVLPPLSAPPKGRGELAPWNFEPLVFVPNDAENDGVPGLSVLAHLAIPIEPPCNWPVSNDIRTALALEWLARRADSYEGIPCQIKDPAEDTIVTRLLAWAIAVFHAIVRGHH
jgi:hypothetical protein